MFIERWQTSLSHLEALRGHIDGFATAGTFRQRTTYIMCVQEMLAAGLGDVVVAGGAFWETLTALVRDPVVDVRIRAARLIGLISGEWRRPSAPVFRRGGGTQ